MPHRTFAHVVPEFGETHHAEEVAEETGDDHKRLYRLVMLYSGATTLVLATAVSFCSWHPCVF